MNEKLTIRNFGPIKKADIEFKKTTVLIGEQGTGKSAITKLIYVLNSSGFLLGTEKERKSILDLYGIFFKRNTEFEFFTKQFKVLRKQNKFFIDIFDTRENELQKLIWNKGNLSKADISALKQWNQFHYLIKSVTDVIYVPAERIALSASLRLLRNTPNRDLYQGNFDQYIIDFANHYDIASKEVLELIIPHLENVSYSSRNSIEKVKFNKDDLFFYQTSSGFQVSIPLIVLFQYYGKEQKRSNKFIIEEPELNLFPTAQYKLVKFFAEKINFSKNTLLLTTHSPYILTSLNNLLQAHSIGTKRNRGLKISKIIEKKYWVDPNVMSAYMLHSNGISEDIMDREEGLIRAEKIDSVSTIINDEFDKLLRIDLGIKRKS